MLQYAEWLVADRQYVQVSETMGGLTSRRPCNLQLQGFHLHGGESLKTWQAGGLP